MTHKKFHRCRWICMIIIAMFIVCGRVAGNTVGGSENNGAPAIVFAIILVVALLFILLFGRIICGFFCPLGLFQDVLWKVSEKLHLPKIPRDEKFMKIINILNKVFLVFFICGIASMTVVSVFSPETLKGAKAPVIVFVLMPVFMILLNSFARRFFCNVCPIGSFIGLFERLNIIRLKKDCSACTLCGACYEACPMRIKEIYTETEKTDVSSQMCMYCGECIKKCPEDNALAITVCGKEIYKSSREDFMNNQFTDLTVKKNK